MKITINQASGQSIELEADENTTLLELMEAAQLNPEYQCREGHCGSCRCELVEGDVAYTNVALASTDAKEILPCICTATSDLKLEKVNCQKIDKKKA